MKIERALKLRDSMKTRLADLYSMARIGGMTSDDINKAYASILAENKGAPQWVRSYLDGYRAALQDATYHCHLVFGGFVGGKFMSTHSSRPDYYARNGVDPGDWATKAEHIGHYWQHNLKPFYVM